MNAQEAIEDLASWFQAGEPLTPEQWAEYRWRLAQYRDQRQQEFTLAFPDSSLAE